MTNYTKSRFWRWMKGWMQKHMHGMITCQEFESFVSEYLDNGLTSLQRSRFERHMRMCQECRQYMEAYQRAIEVGTAVFPSLDEPLADDVPEGLIQAILKSRNEKG